MKQRFILIWVLAFVFLAGVTGCHRTDLKAQTTSTHFAEAEKQLKKAWRLESEGYPKEAVTAYRDLTRTFSNYIPGHLAYQSAFLKNGGPPGSLISEYRSFRNLHPLDAQWPYLFERLSPDGHLAPKIFQLGLNTDPAFDYAFFEDALFLHANGKKKKAVQLVETLLNRNDLDMDLRVTIVKHANVFGEEKALSWMLRFLREYPSHPEAFYVSNKIEMDFEILSMGKLSDIPVQEWRFISRAPKEIPLSPYLAMQLWRSSVKGRVPLAKRMLKEKWLDERSVLALTKELLSLGISSKKEKEPKMALRLLDALLKKMDGESEVWTPAYRKRTLYYRAMAHRELGKFEHASLDFENALQIEALPLWDFKINEVFASTQDPEAPALPDFSLVTSEGKEKTLADFPCAVKVIAVWQGHCDECNSVLGSVQQTLDELGRGDVCVITINPQGVRNRQYIEKYALDKEIEGPIVYDYGPAWDAGYLSSIKQKNPKRHVCGEGYWGYIRRLGVEAVPTLIVVGPDGRVYGVQEGEPEGFDASAWLESAIGRAESASGVLQ